MATPNVVSESDDPSSYAVVVVGFSPWYWTLTDTIKETTEALASEGYEVFFVNCHLGPRSLSTYRRIADGKHGTTVNVIRQHGDMFPYSLYKAFRVPKLTGSYLNKRLPARGPVIIYRCTSSPASWEVEQLLTPELKSRLVCDVVEVLDHGLPCPQYYGIPQVVTAVNRSLAEEMSAALGRNVPVLHQGVSQQWFQIPDGPRSKVIGHFGNFGRLDVPLVVAAAELMPDWTIKLVGPGFDGLSSFVQDLIRGCPNVEVHEPVHRDALPTLAEDVAVWWILLSDTEFNRKSAPIKLVQALASGRPVVASMMPWAKSNGNVNTVETAQECASITEQLYCTWTADKSRDQRESVVGDTWSLRARRIIELANDVVCSPLSTAKGQRDVHGRR